MKKTYLKVKIKSLAEEAKIIKKEECKWLALPFTSENVRMPHPLYSGLRHHRIHEVRTEARAANLAYGYLRRRPYHIIEFKCHEHPNWDRVVQLVVKYGGDRCSDRKLTQAAIQAWFEMT